MSDLCSVRGPLSPLLDSERQAEADRLADRLEDEARKATYTDILRGGVFLQMIIVCGAACLRESDQLALQSLVDILDQRMDVMTHGSLVDGSREAARKFFAGEGANRSLRELAWDAAQRLIEEGDWERRRKWAAILREALSALPECGAKLN